MSAIPASYARTNFRRCSAPSLRAGRADMSRAQFVALTGTWCVAVAVLLLVLTIVRLAG
jgi:hypothetical protein